MARSRTGLYVAGLGVLAVLIALLANPLGISSGGFGAKHILLLVVGIALIIGGLVAQRRAVVRR
ncbi:MAG TPA: hypothetical protein VE727_01650 [Solirubrobacterales bacterium]|nr:hypothetical protein [Solirubrobacterales bacterium]